MALRIETFDNIRGGNTLYKALTHPHAARPGHALVAALAAMPPTAIVDPLGGAEGFAEIFALADIDIAGIYVQDVARLGGKVLGRRVALVDRLAESGARSVLVAAFDADRLIGQLRPYLPADAQVLSLDAMRIPEERLTNHRTYLDPLNFATNFALFRDTGALHTSLETANYWSGYGSAGITLWFTLFDESGEVIGDWSYAPPPGPGSLSVASRWVRNRFNLGDFAGQLFIHVAGAAGHDVVKYALDTFSEADSALSCTHDANAWPSERYAGLPAPAPGERVILWLQNSHPVPIPPAAIGFNPMGEEQIVPISEPIPPFATRAVDIGKLLPELAWPAQVELRAGKHTVRPRYEVVQHRRRRIAHVNVERGDLRPDPELPGLGCILGKGYLLPAPIMPLAEWQTVVLPTPMAVCQAELPIAARVYDPEGREILRHPLGRLPRAHEMALEIDAVAGIDALGRGY